MNSMDFWNNFFANSEREHDLKNKSRIENLINKIKLNNFSLEDISNLQSYIARDFNFFGIRSDRDFLRFLADIQSRRRMLTTMQRAKLLAYLNNDLNEINIRLNNNPAMDKEGYREEMREEINKAAQETAKPWHIPDDNISSDSKEISEDVRSNEAKMLFDAITKAEKALKESPNNEKLKLALDIKKDELNRAIAEGRIDKEYYDSLVPVDIKTHQAEIPDEVFDNLDRIQEENNNTLEDRIKKEKVLDNIDSFKEPEVHDEGLKEEAFDNIDNFKEEKTHDDLLEEAFNNIDAKKKEDEKNKAEKEANQEQGLKDFNNWYDTHYYQRELSQDDGEVFKKKKENMFSNIDAKKKEDEKNKAEKEANQEQGLKDFNNWYDTHYYQRELSHDNGEAFMSKKENMFNNIDAITGAKDLPETETPEIVIDPKEEVTREASVVLDNPITLQTISDEVTSHQEVLETIDKIHEVNSLYEKQMNNLGHDRLSLSLKREMLKEIKKNNKTLELMKIIDARYVNALIIIEKIQLYEKMPYTKENKKKIKKLNKALTNVCGKNYEYLPEYFINEINNIFGRNPNELKIVDKKKVSKKKFGYKKLVAGGLAAMLAISIPTISHIAKDKDKNKEPIEITPVIEETLPEPTDNIKEENTHNINDTIYEYKPNPVYEYSYEPEDEVVSLENENPTYNPVETGMNLANQIINEGFNENTFDLINQNINDFNNFINTFTFDAPENEQTFTKGL